MTVRLMDSESREAIRHLRRKLVELHCNYPLRDPEAHRIRSIILNKIRRIRNGNGKEYANQNETGAGLSGGNTDCPGVGWDSDLDSVQDVLARIFEDCHTSYVRRGK